MRRGIRGDDAHVFVDDQQTLAHAAHRRFKQGTDGKTLRRLTQIRRIRFIRVAPAAEDGLKDLREH
jgi:hypothetical protein